MREIVSIVRAGIVWCPLCLRRGPVIYRLLLSPTTQFTLHHPTSLSISHFQTRWPSCDLSFLLNSDQLARVLSFNLSLLNHLLRLLPLPLSETGNRYSTAVKSLLQSPSSYNMGHCYSWISPYSVLYLQIKFLGMLTQILITMIWTPGPLTNIRLGL